MHNSCGQGYGTVSILIRLLPPALPGGKPAAIPSLRASPEPCAKAGRDISASPLRFACGIGIEIPRQARDDRHALAHWRCVAEIPRWRDKRFRLRHCAPSLKLTGVCTQQQMRRSPIRIFHAMEKSFPHCGKIRPFFPRHGKYFRRFSTPWKIFRRFFHTVENPEHSRGTPPPPAAPDR